MSHHTWLSIFNPRHLCFSSLSEEVIEDVEGPSETAADPEELAKEQESGGEKDQTKWTGSVCSCPQALQDFSPWKNEVNNRESRYTLNLPPKYCIGSG
jgi:hypothetical protein